jgi:Gene product 88
MSKNWNLVRLFESVNGVNIKGDLKEQDELNAQLNEIDWSGDFADVKKVCIPPEQLKKDLNDVLANRAAKPADRTKIGVDKPLVHGAAIQQDEDGDIDVEQLIDNISQLPNEILSVNGKMVKSESENQIMVNIGIPALRGLVFDQQEKQFYYVNTCPGAGTCALICYARKGSYVMFKNVFVKQTRILNLLLNDPAQFQNILQHELELVCAKNKGMEIVLRWNDAGDFFTKKYFQIAKDITSNLQAKGYKFKSYGYSKMSDVVNDPSRPADFTINFSDDANKRETGKVNTDTAKKSVIVKRELFSDLIKREGRHYAKDANEKLQFNNPMALDTLKQRLADKYGVDKKSIITYEKMLSIPEGQEPKWNVIVMPSGDGDVSAQRQDVRITFLLEH